MFHVVTFQTTLTSGATGTNLATGATAQATTDTDAHSLQVTPFGGLMFTSGADASGLDDAVFVTTPAGTLYVADTQNNRVLQVEMSDLEPMSLYAPI